MFARHRRRAGGGFIERRTGGGKPVRRHGVTRDAYSIQPSGRAVADVTFRGNTGNYILLIYGRLAPSHGVATGRLTIEGSQKEADNFTAWFKGF